LKKTKTALTQTQKMRTRAESLNREGREDQEVAQEALEHK